MRFSLLMLALAFLPSRSVAAQASTAFAQASTVLSRVSIVFARVGERVITVGDVEAAAHAAGVHSPAEVRDVARELVEHELLLREARRRGFGSDLLARDAWRGVMVQRFLRTEIDVRITRASISDEDIRARYESAADDYSRNLSDSSEGIRGTLWRERRDGAVADLVEQCETRTPVAKHPEVLDSLHLPEDSRTGREQFVASFGCAHCARQLAREPQASTSVFGTPVPELPDWARRNRSEGSSSP